MYEGIKAALITWNSSTTERQKLQHTHLFIIVIAVLVAGVVSLIEPETGHTLVKIALFALLVFLANAVVWNLLQSGLLTKLADKSRRK